MPEKDRRRIIHLFKDDSVNPQFVGPILRVFTYDGPYSTKTLCGEHALGLYVYPDSALFADPIKQDHERLCKRCLRSKDAGLRLLRMT